MSIRSKTNLILSMIISISLFLLTYFGYVISKGIVEQSNEQLINSQLDKRVVEVELYLRDTVSKVEGVSRLSKLMDVNPQEAVPELKRVFPYYKDTFVNISFANAEGIRWNYKGDEGFIGQRDYFHKIMEERTSVISDVLVSNTTGLLSVIVGAPIINDNNEIKGVAYATLALENVQKLVSTQQYGISGYGFLIDHNGIVLAHGKQKELLGKSILSLDADNPLKYIWDKRELATGADRKFLSYSIQGNRYKCVLAPVNIAGNSQMYLGLTVSLQEMEQNINQLTKIFLMILLLSICIGNLIVAKYSKNLVKPILILNHMAMEIANGNLNAFDIEVKTHDELEQLYKSLDHMTNHLQSLREIVEKDKEDLKISNMELSTAYEEIMASEEEMSEQYKKIQDYNEQLIILKQKYEIAIEGTRSTVWELNVEDDVIAFALELDDKNPQAYEFHAFKDAMQQIWSNSDEKSISKELLDFKIGKLNDLNLQLQIKDENGNPKWLLVRGKGVFDKERNLKQVNGIFLDITELKNKEAYIKQLAYYDSLTKLPNRLKFLEILKEKTISTKSGAILLLDLDNFKGINDTLGHVYGDKILEKIAQLLIQPDLGEQIVSRFGGDEFVILIEEEEIDRIEAHARKIANKLKSRILVGQDEIYISCSIGITRFPFDSDNVNQLIMNADLSMYKAKEIGKNTIMFFTSEMTSSLTKHIHLQKLVREALASGEFVVFYQPQVNTYTGEISGFEALIRMKHHSISPADFIPVAEETGMVLELGRWVVKEVIRQIATWRSKGLKIKPVAINFSAKQLSDSGFIDFLKEELSAFSLGAENIVIEITESIFLNNKDATVAFLNQLKQLGVLIALDDFGTGYSSLSYLTFLPVDKIKLDKSLIDKFLLADGNQVVSYLISIAHNLQMQVVSEGIETIEQFHRLKEINCDCVQGFLFSKPLPVHEVEKIYDQTF